jgi:hypothetical protein
MERSIAAGMGAGCDVALPIIPRSNQMAIQEWGGAFFGGFRLSAPRVGERPHGRRPW